MNMPGYIQYITYAKFVLVNFCQSDEGTQGVEQCLDGGPAAALEVAAQTLPRQKGQGIRQYCFSSV